MQGFDFTVPPSSNPSPLGRLALFTHPGGRAVNQDALGAVGTGTQVFAVLADGAGGHTGGDYAARFLVDEALLRLTECAPKSPLQLQDLALALNDALLMEQRHQPDCGDMHSTLLIFCVSAQSPRFMWCHCGDSRLYLITPQGVQWHTRDHSLLQCWKDQGLQGDLPEQASVLYSAMGEPSETVQVDVGSLDADLPKGSLFVLASDGFWGAMNEAELYRALTATDTNLQEALHRHGLSLSRRAGPGADNLSALVWLDEGSAA